MRSLVLLSLLLAGTASAQTPLPEFRLERFNFNAGISQGLTTATGDLSEAGQVHALLGFHYENSPLVLMAGSARQGAVIEHRWTAHALVGAGITSWLQADLEVPIILYQRGNSISGLQSPDRAGLSSPLLSARVGLTSQRKGGLFASEFPVDIAFQLAAALPITTGKTLSKEFALAPQLSVGRDFGGFRLGGELFSWIRPENTVLSSGGSSVRDSVGSQLGLRLVGMTKVKNLVGLELSGNFGFPLASGQTPVGTEVLAGVRVPVAMLEVFALGGPGFGGLPGNPSYRLMAGVSFTQHPVDPCAPGEKHTPQQCPELDDDGDGVKNKVDQCPLEKEDRDAFLDEDGCPDPDNDHDGIPDSEDNCPDTAGTVAEKGCPVVDTDKDGVPDKQDECPTEAGPVERKGCPVHDTDGDGIEDKDDACLSQSGPAENKGCPIPDEDKDGVNDKDDACPKEPGPKELKGCPDRDGDTVTDALDNCPDEKGEVDNAGCPKAKKQLVVITREKLVIKDRIYFATGKAEILPKSFPLVNQIADVLAAHLEIASIRIEGHTDNEGPREVNVKLSQARAEAVKTYLVKQRKVADTRLKAQGFGPDRPAESNDTKDGKANNRRVEFMIEGAPEAKQIEATDAK
ncbi:MAG TPA: OmpA family protein [Myxococcales bacterium]|jgi:outer membrane protein OmpA-like peptidoglycan-associated protein